MANSFRLNKVDTLPDGQVQVYYQWFGGGGGQEFVSTFPSQAAMLTDADAWPASPEHAVMLVVRYWLGRDPAGTNPGLAVEEFTPGVKTVAGTPKVPLL